jgi:adenylate cyclase
MNETRKLAAILVADVVGYSRLAGADEDRTLARLRGLRSDLIDPAIAAHRGRIVKRTGDGSIIEFRSVVDAVRCAIELQSGLIERNAGVPEDRRIEFRVGIHVGDVVEESDGDLMGDGVNIAARLEAICQPGAVCLSEDAYRQVRQRLDLKVTDLGKTQLKNIAEPVHVYALEVGQPAEAKQAPSTSQKREPPRLSLVVLPFANIGGDPEEDYFVDGITESLTTDLSRVSGAFVIGRRTALTYKGKAADVKEIGLKLNVRYVLEGSAQRDQNRVRINAQLVDAGSGAHLWADRFDEDAARPFGLQDQVVARLAASLGYVLINAEAEKGARSANPSVIDLTMRGWTLIWRAAQQTPYERRERADEARALFDQALQVEPDDPDALAGSAYTYYVDFAYGWSDAPIDYETKVLEQASRAIALAPDNVRAYFVKAIYLATSGRPTEALGAADAGLAINPNFVLLLSPRAAAENSLGRFEQAKADCERAMRLSPRDPFSGVFRLWIGAAELGLGHFEAAVDAFRKAIDSGYRPFFVYSSLAAAYAQAGKMDEADAALAEARRLNPKLTVKWYVARGVNAALIDGVRKAGLAEN